MLKPYYEDNSGVLYCGDCLEILKQLPDESVDLVLTDPPYRVISGGPNINMAGSVVGKNDGKLFEHNDIKISQWLLLVKEKMKEETQGYCFVNQLNLHDFLDEYDKNNLSIHRLLIWDKKIATWTQFYMKQYEPIIFFRKGKAKPINEQGSGDILRFANPKNKKHPTEKPVDLLKVLTRNSSKQDDTVLDPFAGSGTTLRAAKDLGRKWIGIEISEKYCEIIAKRMGQEVLF